MWVNELWMLLAYVVGTGLGIVIGMKMNLKGVIEDTIDSLIEQGYLRTKGSGDNVEILKHWEEDDQTSG